MDLGRYGSLIACFAVFLAGVWAGMEWEKKEWLEERLRAQQEVAAVERREKDELADAVAIRDAALESLGGYERRTAVLLERVRRANAAAAKAGNSGDLAAKRFAECRKLVERGAELVGRGGSLLGRLAADRKAVGKAVGGGRGSE